MLRLARVVVPGLPHHVVQRGNRRQDVFFSDSDRAVYLRIVRESAAKLGVAIRSWCLMTNHVHFVAAAGEAKLRSTPASHTVTVEHRGRAFALTLRRTGKRGGRLKVTRTAGGRRLHEGALPGTVEDHWRHYRGAPNFRTWITDPRYGVIIEPTDEDRSLIRKGDAP